MDERTKLKLQAVADVLEKQVIEIIAHGSVRLHVYYSEEFEKSWQDTCIMGTATLCKSDVSLDSLSLFIINLLTRQVVFRCDELKCWEQQNEYWYSFINSYGENREYIAGLCFYDDKEAHEFHSKIMDYSGVCSISFVDSTRILKQHQQKQQIESLEQRNAARGYRHNERATPLKQLEKKRSFFDSIAGMLQRETMPRKLTVLSDPSNFTQVSGIDGGIKVDELPDHWKNVFDKAGISTAELQDKKVARFLIKSLSVITRQQDPRADARNRAVVKEEAILDMNYDESDTTSTDSPSIGMNFASDLDSFMSDYAMTPTDSSERSEDHRQITTDLLPIDELLQEIRKASLRRSVRSIPLEIDESQEEVFASNLSSLMSARRASMEDDTGSSDSGAEL